MNINKTTTNFADRRGIDIQILKSFDKGCDLISIAWQDPTGEMGDGSEIVNYLVGENGATFYNGMSEHCEDLPGFINDEMHLRLVIAFLSTQQRPTI